MRNPFVAMAMAAVAMQQAFRGAALAAFNKGEFSERSPAGSMASLLASDGRTRPSHPQPEQSSLSIEMTMEN